MARRLTEPSIRKPLGVGLILAIVLVWSLIVAGLSPYIGRLPGWAEAIVYLVAGIVWIVPLGPVLKWMETGRWR